MYIKNIAMLCFITAASSMLNGCGIVNKVRLMNANNDIEATWVSNKDSAYPKADFVYAKPYVYGSIDGVNGLKFLIDTGSSISMIFDTPKIKQLEVTKGYELIVGGYGGHQHSAAYQTEVGELVLDAVSFREVNFGYIPISETKFFLRPDQVGFDGVIGNDILKDLIWHFDRDSSTVSIYKTMPPSIAEKNTTWTPFDTFFGKISFPAKITFSDHELERDIILDTGSRYHMSINDGYFDGDKRFPTPTIESAGYSLSGMAIHRKANTPSVEVGDLKFTNVVTNIIEEDEDDFWTLGSALLSQYEIIVDYPKRRLGFVQRPGHVFKSQYNLVGLELRKLQNGNFVVVYTSPDLPARSLDFAIGTEVTHVNGKPSNSIAIDEWLSMASNEGVFEFCITQNYRCETVYASPIRGFSADKK